VRWAEETGDIEMRAESTEGRTAGVVVLEDGQEGGLKNGISLVGENYAPGADLPRSRCR
jgi:hypothetical protein